MSSDHATSVSALALSLPAVVGGNAAAAGSYLLSLPLAIQTFMLGPSRDLLSLSPSAALSRGNNCCLVDSTLPPSIVASFLLSLFSPSLPPLFPAERKGEREGEALSFFWLYSPASFAVCRCRRRRTLCPSFRHFVILRATSAANAAAKSTAEACQD